MPQMLVVLTALYPATINRLFTSFARVDGVRQVSCKIVMSAFHVGPRRQGTARGITVQAKQNFQSCPKVMGGRR